METSIFIAKILGSFYLLVGFGFLINADYYRKVYNDIIKSSSHVFLWSPLTFVVGFLLVYYHNIWVKDWTVIITIVGWIALIKGILLIVFPKSLIDFSKSFLKKKECMAWCSVCALILGFVLAYFGFIAG